MNVLKFGGTSVGTVDSLLHVKSIVESRTEPVIVVVSALGGVTDMLITAANMACTANTEWKNIHNKIVERHRVVVDALVPPQEQKEVWKEISQMLNRLEKYYYGIELVEDLSERTLCNVVSFGERMSALLVSKIINNATLLYSPDFIKTEKWFGRNIAVTELTDTLIRNTFEHVNAKAAIVPGFISSDRDSADITNLGRGGSDFTAALIAAALNADCLEIWTDVDGFMTADPRIISDATVIPHLSFLESMDLCNFGAKVIYPPTIYPVFHKNIPIRILNTFNPNAPGTLITDRHNIPVPRPFRGVTSIAATSILEIQPTQAFRANELRNRVLNVLTKKGVEILLSAYEDVEDAPIRIVMREADAPRSERMIRENLSGEDTPVNLPAIRIIPEVSTVTLVGENLKIEKPAAQRMLHTLNRGGIEVLTSGMGASGFAMTAVIKAAKMNEALTLLHDNFLT